VIVKHKEV